MSNATVEEKRESHQTKTYLKPVGQPWYFGIRILHRKENILHGDDSTLWYSFDPQR
uniref:Uncharacterized protein n=1 Tax=Parascaris equorum TaxID=6256 RepID=A0A914RPE3_PAREQ